MAGAKLTDTQVSKTKVKDKPYKLSDGHGLFLYVTPAGGKFWRWQYRFHGKPQLLSVGEYPAMSLKDARTAHQQWQGVLRGGGNPAVEKKVGRKAEAVLVKLNQERSVLAKIEPLDGSVKGVVWPEGSFGAVQAEWFEKWSGGDQEEDRDKKSPRYVEQMKSRIGSDILPKLGHRHIADIEAPDIAQMALEIEKRGAKELARKALRVVGQVFRFAIQKGYARRNPAADIKPSDVLKAKTTTNCARIDKRDLPALLLKMENDTGTEITRYAMWIMARTFLRTTELRGTPWVELDLDGGWWEIPKERMKMDNPHIVPLSRQVIEAFQKLKEITGDGEYVFPGAFDRKKCMSSNTILSALARMGYHGVMTGHGYRGLASTILHEGAKVSPILRQDGYREDWIELQLAHMPQNKVSAAYNYAKYLDSRKQMMQDWSDYLDEQLNKAKQGA
ncbi:MAG: integrase arm-type DNA-binding domain-containing protein [Terracidiphilus sp.]|jgi:integrase